MKHISALVLRKKLGEIIDAVVKKKEPLAISRANKPLVVLLPYDQYAPFQLSQERRERLRKVAGQMDQWAQRNAEALRGIDPVQAVRETRDER